LATWIGVGVVLCGLILMVVSYGGWRNDRHGKARLAFEKKLISEIAADAPLFDKKEQDADNVMVMAYRLKRQIERRPIVCAKRNGYFLTATDPLPVGQARVLATLGSSKIALVRILADGPSIGTENCQDHSFPAADKGDN
jgi:hypothetical protein